jgi:hypothetical protein
MKNYKGERLRCDPYITVQRHVTYRNEDYVLKECRDSGGVQGCIGTIVAHSATPLSDSRCNFDLGQ